MARLADSYEPATEALLPFRVVHDGAMGGSNWEQHQHQQLQQEQQQHQQQQQHLVLPGEEAATDTPGILVDRETALPLLHTIPVQDDPVLKFVERGREMPTAPFLPGDPDTTLNFLGKGMFTADLEARVSRVVAFQPVRDVMYSVRHAYEEQSSYDWIFRDVETLLPQSIRR